MIVSHDVACASAEAIFGSSSRGDGDAMSDRDILIVDEDTAVLRRRARELKAGGWSVASYTFAKLRYLASRGALFIQHLKLEARILCDSEGKLSSLLDEFKPREGYRAEIRENARLAGLAGATPTGSRGALLAADVLYVAVRNFAVLRLAERGIYRFAYSTLLEGLEEERVIPSGGTRALSRLRFLKCLYRAGEQERGRHVRQIVMQAMAVLPHAHFPKRLEIIEPRAILQSSAPPGWASSYVHLRDLERRLVAVEALQSHAKATGDLEKLSRWIANPRSYAAISSRLAPRLRAALTARASSRWPCQPIRTLRVIVG
jgi:hypothetical protein